MTEIEKKARKTIIHAFRRHRVFEFLDLMSNHHTMKKYFPESPICDMDARSKAILLDSVCHKKIPFHIEAKDDFVNSRDFDVIDYSFIILGKGHNRKLIFGSGNGYIGTPITIPNGIKYIRFNFNAFLRYMFMDKLLIQIEGCTYKRYDIGHYDSKAKLTTDGYIPSNYPDWFVDQIPANSDHCKRLLELLDYRYLDQIPSDLHHDGHKRLIYYNSTGKLNGCQRISIDFLSEFKKHSQRIIYFSVQTYGSILFENRCSLSFNKFCSPPRKHNIEYCRTCATTFLMKKVGSPYLCDRVLFYIN